jgi:hypothetical protein
MAAGIHSFMILVSNSQPYQWKNKHYTFLFWTSLIYLFHEDVATSGLMWPSSNWPLAHAELTKQDQLWPLFLEPTCTKTMKEWIIS